MNYNLLIDIGNSGIKIAKASKNKILNIKRFEYTGNDFVNIIENIPHFFPDNFLKVAVSSLNNKLKKKISEIIKRKFDLTPLFIDMKVNLPLKFKYSDTLGSDRICSAVAAFIKFNNKKNILVIDFGTATTFNLISNGNYLGGLISIGIQTSLKALAQNTTLPLVNFKNIPELINTNTESNIIAGAYYQNLFTAERVIREIRKKYKGLFVVATGGMSDLIMRKTGTIDIYEPNLVLDGLNLILELNVN